jgi:hypothetical protein
VSRPRRKHTSNVCRAGSGELVEMPVHGSSRRKSLVVVLGQHLVAAIAIDLKDAAKAGQMRDRSLGLAIGRSALRSGT